MSYFKDIDKAFDCMDEKDTSTVGKAFRWAIVFAIVFLTLCGGFKLAGPTILDFIEVSHESE